MNLNKFYVNLDKNNFKKDVAISIIFIVCIFFYGNQVFFIHIVFFQLLGKINCIFFLIGLHQLK